MDVYASKPKELPRFLYRNLLQALKGPAEERKTALAAFSETVGALKPSGDWLKLKWCLPPRLASQLSAEEQSQVNAALAAKRGRRNERYLEVFPHCSDEFSFEPEFLDAAFGATRYGLITRETQIFTMGSCFAQNIAGYLIGKDFKVSLFAQAEDLNSPFSNAKMLAICTASLPVQRAYIEHWTQTLYPPGNAPEFPAIVHSEMARLAALAQMICAADVIIITCGNILDNFMTVPGLANEPGPAVAPKFFLISNHENLELTHHVTTQMRSAGAEFRLGSFAETGAALNAQHEALRSLNPDAHILYTLSPVPIYSAIGAKNAHKMGAIELDCISKSSLRTALAAFFEHWSADEKLHYFPSFEVVRWIGSCTDGAAFGNEDAASRHVSQTVLAGVFRYFLHKYCVD